MKRIFHIMANCETGYSSLLWDRATRWKSTESAAGIPVTSKVAIVSKSARPGVDVDYLFAQVKVDQPVVDTSPNCGNMLAGVGPFAIEAGLVRAGSGTTTVRIFNVNTGKLIDALVPTPNGEVTYSGDASIDGVPGTAAPIRLAFIGAAGSKTGKLLPAGAPLAVVHGIEVSCVDAATPVVLIRAADLGKTGYETPSDYASDKAFMAHLETIRIEAGRLMGISDAADRVIPKPVLLAPPERGGHVSDALLHAASMPQRIGHTLPLPRLTAASNPGYDCQRHGSARCAARGLHLCSIPRAGWTCGLTIIPKSRS